jgi:hypothetical protein
MMLKPAKSLHLTFSENGAEVKIARPLRLREDGLTMTRHQKTLKSFEELDQATKERFFDPHPLKLVKSKGKQPGKVTVVEDLPEEEAKTVWKKAFGWMAGK